MDLQTKYYERLRRKFYSKREIVGWGSQKSQEMRFKILTDNFKNIKVKNILDIGCGRGDLAQFLKKKKIKINYCGLDINKEFINIAKKKNPLDNFKVGNFLKVKLKNFDIIFISGVFNLRMEKHNKWMCGFIRKALKKTNKILVFNCLSAHAPKKNRKYFYLDPSKVSNIGLKNNLKFIIDHTYADHDVSFIVFK